MYYDHEVEFRSLIEYGMNVSDNTGFAVVVAVVVETSVVVDVLLVAILKVVLVAVVVVVSVEVHSAAVLVVAVVAPLPSRQYYGVVPVPWGSWRRS